MPTFIRPASFPRHISILILLVVGTCFASAHIAARISFDHNTGLLTAVLFRSAVTVLVLTTVVVIRRQTISLARGHIGWQLLLGLLIACQSISIYSAVSRIPVGIALLVVNTFPVWLALITWGLGGRRPALRVSLIMGGIIVGLLLALDIPARIAEPSGELLHWLVGIGFSLLASLSFAVALWVIEHKLPTVNGTVRSLYTMIVVFICAMAAGELGMIANGLAWPDSFVGWFSLAILSSLYAGAFTFLFIFAPRLDMAQNAPAMNIEPIASLSLGWLILGQALSPIQILGGATVIAGIIVLAYTKQN